MFKFGIRQDKYVKVYLYSRLLYFGLLSSTYKEIIFFKECLFFSISTDHKLFYLILFFVQERFRTITRSYYRSSNAILLVFDVTDVSTFQSLGIWYSDIHSYANQDVDIMLVGSKVDLESDRQVPYEVARAWAEEHGMAYIETSSKTMFNVERAFDVLIRASVANYSYIGSTNQTPNVTFNPNAQPRKADSGGCC